MTSSIRSSGKGVKKSMPKRGDDQHICPITCKIIPRDDQIIFVYKIEGKEHRAIYERKAIDQWVKRYATCPVTNLPLDQLKDRSGKIVWRKNAISKKIDPLTLSILLDTRARIDHLDRAASPALHQLEKLLKGGKTEHKEQLKELGVIKIGDLKGLQEKIDRLAMLVTTASFFKRVSVNDQTQVNLIKLLTGIDGQIGNLLEKGVFKGFFKQTLINKRAVAKRLIQHLNELKSPRGSALERGFCHIASFITSPLEIEQICTLAPQVLLYSKAKE